MMLAFKKDFDLLGDDTVDLSTKIERLKNNKGSYDEKRFEDSEAKLLKQIIDEKRANINMSKIERQMKKQ